MASTTVNNRYRLKAFSGTFIVVGYLMLFLSLLARSEAATINGPLPFLQNISLTGKAEVDITFSVLVLIIGLVLNRMPGKGLYLFFLLVFLFTTPLLARLPESVWAVYLTLAIAGLVVLALLLEVIRLDPATHK